MDGINTSDIPGLLLLFGLPTLIAGVPVIWSVRHRASFIRVTRRFRLNRFTLLAGIFSCWAVESGLEHRWTGTAIAAAGPRRPSINSASAQTSASARSGDRPGPS